MPSGLLSINRRPLYFSTARRVPPCWCSLAWRGANFAWQGATFCWVSRERTITSCLTLLSMLTSAWAVVWLTLLFGASFFRFRFPWFRRISRKACVLLLLSILSWEAFNYATAEHDPLISLGLRWHLERTCSADYLQSWGENELARSRKGDICSPTPARIAALGAARDPANFTIEGEGPRSHVHIEWTTGGWGLFDDFEHWWLDVGPPSFVESARDVRPDFDVASPITVFKIRPGVYAGRGAEWDFP